MCNGWMPRCVSQEFAYFCILPIRTTDQTKQWHGHVEVSAYRLVIHQFVPDDGQWSGVPGQNKELLEKMIFYYFNI